jgi:hypothetical protein
MDGHAADQAAKGCLTGCQASPMHGSERALRILIRAPAYATLPHSIECCKTSLSKLRLGTRAKV